MITVVTRVVLLLACLLASLVRSRWFVVVPVVVVVVVLVVVCDIYVRAMRWPTHTHTHKNDWGRERCESRCRGHVKNEWKKTKTDRQRRARTQNRFLDFYGTFFVYARARMVDYTMDRSRHARGISFFIRMNNFRFLYFLDKVFYIFEMGKIYM